MLRRRDGWLAPSSRGTANTARRSYVAFCDAYGLPHVTTEGVADVVLACFIEHIADNHAYKTIKNYVSMGPRVLCLENGLPWTQLSDRPLVYTLMRAIRRQKGDGKEKAKLGITPEQLTAFYPLFDHKNPEQATIWAAFVVAFWAMLRKGNVTAKAGAVHARQNLKRGDVTTTADGWVWLTLKHTKTLQFYERELKVPLASIPGSPLCPVAALTNMIRLNPASKEDPLFSNLERGTVKPLTYYKLVKSLKECITKIGHDPAAYAGHSFRRGGATLALTLGLDHAWIKLLGDWKSDAYLLYARVTDGVKKHAMDVMRARFMNTVR